ncbi:hypothetical protein CVT24_007274 [Panaeolus cyanescens]|uniref:RNA helicase n=1 Tax=Panaeolus cyanescens TaxID=181874 RepID=A0A409VJ53_9AGAR|nr:hypothetical protein CVT24_007274 [Panaeolus cyanescens]
MGGPPVRESYNAKARQSSAGSRKKGKGKKRKITQNPAAPPEDPNALILDEKSQEEKEKERKQRMLEELAAQSESKWSSKKKRRLEKYIEKKLKKEERVVIFEKLAKTQASLPSALLQSSSTLGSGKLSTHQERIEALEDSEVRKAIHGNLGKRKRHTFSVDENDEPANEDINEISDKSTSAALPVEVQDQSAPPPKNSNPDSLKPTTSVVGSALQRNPDGSLVAPKVVKKRKNSGKTQRGWGLVSQRSHLENDSDSSFDSSDSEYDSDPAGERMDHEDITITNTDSHSEDEVNDGTSENTNSDSESDNGGEDMEGEDEISGEVSVEPAPPKKKFGFKEWATKQLNAAKGYEESSTPSVTTSGQSIPVLTRATKHQAPRDEVKRGPLGRDLDLPSTNFAQQVLSNTKDTSKTTTRIVEVLRKPEVQESRLLLPIVSEEQPIMEAILLNPVVIICGETGSGKTTQVPQFLYEAGFGSPDNENSGMIGITQPRRVAAMSMASRVAHELSLPESRVSYQIRYDATVSPTTSIKFMTDGVLLRELATDFLLSKYSVIIIDEAHERSINTDILIGVLSRVIKLREQMWKEKKEGVKPLRLIIMSATLRVSDFADNKNLFPTPPPVINVNARQHPVTIHFSRRTSSDYVTEAVKKTIKIHTRLPPGGILVFLTGQNEITGVCKKLEARFGGKRGTGKNHVPGKARFKYDDHNPEQLRASAAQADIEVEDIDLGNSPDDLAMDVDGLEGEDEDNFDSDDELGMEGILPNDEDSQLAEPMHVVPLYSLLSSERQMRVFEPPPVGSRLVVVATNIAETSLTIPGIRYVVDCGRAKERQYDISSGVQKFQVSWISKASAAQRAGRAGRTGPGHCYRLFSSALFENHFDKFALPEIQRMPIEGVVLQMKSMHIDSVINFPFPTAPEHRSLQKAEKLLASLGALTPSQSHSGKEAAITDLGRAMSLFPLNPRFSLSALSVGDPFIYEEALHQTVADDDESPDTNLRRAYFQTQQIHSSLGGGISDIFKLLSVIGAYEFAGGGQQFCRDHFVRPKAMEEIHKLRAQISNIVQTNFPSVNAGFVPQLPPPNDKQLKVIRQLLTAAFIDQVAIRKDLVENTGSRGTQYAITTGVAYRALGVDDDVFIHPSSVLAKSTPPNFVVFHEILRTSKVYLKGVTTINPVWLPSLAKNGLCTFSKPVKNGAGVPMVIPRFGPDNWELPAIRADSLKA